MDAPREDAKTSRDKLESRAWGPVAFMPWARDEGRRVNCDGVLVIEAGRNLWPDEMGCLNAPLPLATGCMTISLLLLLVDIARAAKVDVMIEKLIDKDLPGQFAGVAMSEQEKIVTDRMSVRGYRFWILCTFAQAATMGEILSRRMATQQAAPQQAQNNKRKRGGSATSGPNVAAGVKRPGIFAVGKDVLQTEREVRVSIMQYYMGLRQVAEGPWDYSVGTAAAERLDAGENAYDDGDDAEDNSMSYDAKNPLSHFFATVVFADATTIERWDSWNIDEKYTHLDSYWSGKHWKAVDPAMCTFVDGGSNWFEENMATPDEVPPLKSLKDRFIKDYRDRGVLPPDFSTYTHDDIRSWHQPTNGEEALLASEHSTYLPITAESRYPTTWKNNAEYTLACAFPGMTGGQHTLQCAQRVAARANYIVPFFELVERVMRNLFLEKSLHRPDCYAVAAEAAHGGKIDGVDRSSRIARSMHGHISKKLRHPDGVYDFGSFQIMNICQVATEYYGLTQQQSVSFMIMYRAVGRLGYFNLGTAIFIANMAEIDTGKTWVLERVTDSIPPELVLAMGSCTPNAWNINSHGNLVVVDDAGDSLSASEFKLRTLLSNSKHSHTRNEPTADGGWEVKSTNYVFNNSQYWNTNGALSDQLFDRTLALLGQRRKQAGRALAHGELTRLDRAVQPVDAARQAAPAHVMRMYTAYNYELWALQALLPVMLNKTMFSIVVAIGRATLGDEFSMESRLIKLAENLALSTMSMRVTSCWYRKLQPEHCERPVILSDGSQGGSRLLDFTAHDKHMFFMLNSVVTAMDSYRSLEEVRRNSNYDAIRSKIASELSTMVEHENDQIEGVSAPGRDDYWVTTLQVGHECKMLADHLAGFSYEGGIVTTLWKGIKRDKYLGQPIIGTGTGRYNRSVTVLKSWLLQSQFISSDEQIIWKVLFFIFDNRPDLWAVEFDDEQDLVFSSRVHTLLKKPGSPDPGTFAIPDRYGFLPENSDKLVVPPAIPVHSYNAKVDGAGALDRALHKMAMRPGFGVFETRKTANLIDENDVPSAGLGWEPVDPDGLCYRLRNNGSSAASLQKRVHTLDGAIVVPYDDFCAAREVVASGGTGIADMTPARKRFVERCTGYQPAKRS